ncbi:MAG: alpha-ketoglutarate-dependent dioxygenase AlkB [Bdellovibrio sp. CG12_big_fil_rev_8_21_14_0_65_39_13]|nr:MAG: alpha-ketoglutarate-dependent dioxygenase AlkB [Bdellovibrio sp. CG22_combo_CG10-13_8_21_14_all_39_27]PIQ62977.1 MAG: alpha-ketoglutarate-dependent dioxygenase AlkB [Bdellovibrio sp. CG12_big_fil_rev_8_21_14_0_65_39_13]PIR32652.1 MAG: alpha-ketoglutarate-dependent dioxygenase AlkB [Bdellovibrio sp. CG11_big_fil_rev_8_21_14_0_20_39_38]PJB52637.1 MAG: alpha-ketoglutarate-dependent dioxygenase AlkB [Bdellovibrio sp. CG_4_9_14_3_um_filter_39_7]
MKVLPKGLLYQKFFINKEERKLILEWLETLVPLWEMRYSKHHPPPEGDEQRPLLRPVYWLGNWQFACLGYYHPPEGIHNRSVHSTPYPPLLDKIVKRIEFLVKRAIPSTDIPKGWKLNTCLVNFYGDKLVEKKWEDRARVGEHKDFEPGPVASLSLGDRAFFQFVSGKPKVDGNKVFWEGWLEDSSLQVFAGKRFKEQFFHRVQRVDRKSRESFSFRVEDFKTRRINFTFRFVPPEHIVNLHELPSEDLEDVLPLAQELAKSDPFFQRAIAEIIRS